MSGDKKPLDRLTVKAAAKQGPKTSSDAKANVYVSTMATRTPYHLVVWIQDPAKK